MDGGEKPVGAHGHGPRDHHPTREMDGEKEGSGAKLTEWQNEDEGDSESMVMRRSGRRLRRPCFGCDHVNPRERKLVWGKRTEAGLRFPLKGRRGAWRRSHDAETWARPAVAFVTEGRAAGGWRWMRRHAGPGGQRPWEKSAAVVGLVG
jgi:hypothetical protein